METPAAAAVTYKTLPRGINYLGALEAKLRDLQGFATLAFELIQNADDAFHATRISFRVSDAGLVVENDGQFLDCGLAEEPTCSWIDDPQRGHMCDFHRFREVSSRDKREQLGTAGAFGVGFTAVYQITDRPELVSAGRHWVIHEESPEEERIVVCPGCEKCSDERFQGTRFYLPWASDANSELRRALRAPTMAADAKQKLIAELTSSIPEAMLFLKQLNNIEVLDSDECVARFERLVVGNSILINDRSRDTTWHIVSSNFDNTADVLRATSGNRIERKRTANVRIAIPADPIRAGLLCAYLPTQQDTGLPFHINADFFTPSDRKSVILESDYQSDWNRAALCAAADALAKHLAQLATWLGAERTWQIIDATYKAYSESREGQRDAVFQVFWERISSVLPSSPIAECTNGKWKCPPDVVMLRDADEHDALPVLTAIGLNILRPEMRQHVFHLPRWAGIQLLDIGHVVRALHSIGLTRRCELAKAPEVVQKSEDRELLLVQLERLLGRKKLPEQRSGLEQIGSCALFLGTDGALWPSSEVYAADPHSMALFAEICPDLPFWAGEANAVAPTVMTGVPRLSAAVVIGYLEARSFKLDCAAAPGLLRWFESRKDEIHSARDLKARLAALAIFPSATGLKPLQNLALTGGEFLDPIGVTDLIDLRGLSSIRDFLVEIGARQLTFERYAGIYLPKTIRAGAELTLPKVRSVIQLLSARLGEIRDNPEVRSALSSLALIECTDGQVRRPADVYFGSEVVASVLGTGVAVAAMGATRKEAIADLYRWLRVAESPRFEDITQRVADLSAHPVVDAKREIEEIVKHLGERLRTFDQLPQELRRLQVLRWLPARGVADQWFKPSELYLTYRDYLFSTQGRFLDLSAPVQRSSGQFLRLVGLHENPSVSQVVAHLLTCATSGDPVNREVYGFLNEHASEPSVLTLRGEPCLMLAEGKYVEPSRVFWNAHPFGRFRMQLGTELFKYSDLLARIGVRPSPIYQDALAVLEEISTEYGNVNANLDEHAHHVVMACWAMLTSALGAGHLTEEALHALSSKKVIPAPNGILERPVLMFFEDRAGLAAKFSKLLASNVIRCPEGAWGAMAAAGVRFLTTVVSSRVVDVSDPTLDSSIGAGISNRRPQLARVLDPVGNGTGRTLDLEVLINIRCYSSGKLLVQFFIDAFNRRDYGEVEEVKAYFEQESQSLYFVARGGQVPWAAIAREISSVLDGKSESGRVALALMQVLSAPDLQSASSLLDELGFPPIDQVDTTGESGAQVTDLGQEGAITPPAPNLIPPKGGGGGGEGASTQPHGGRQQQEPTLPGSPPTTQPSGNLEGSTSGGGSQEPRPEGEPPPETKPKARYPKKSKFRTYVVHGDEEGSEVHEGGDSDSRSEVDEAGIQHVCDFELSQQRHPTVMAKNNPGFDIKSVDKDGFIARYIEVKSCSGEWDARGVPLSKTQFDDGKTLGDLYWFYVVERATSPDFRIYRIQDPARRVTEFLYDDGWTAVAEPDPMPLDREPATTELAS